MTSKSKLHTDSFYVRPLASWVPHLLFPSFLPKCPKCCSNKDINLGESRWVDFPIILCGIGTHRYLDTFYNHCDNCKGKFAGYNKKTMQLNADQHVGYFNFYLGEKGCAVDEELYSYIIHQATSEATSVIHERLHKMAVDCYVNNYYKYLHAVSADKVKFAKRGNVAVNDTQQSTLDHHFVVAGTHTLPIRNSISDIRDEIRNIKYQLQHATALADGDVDLHEVIELKKNNNCVDPPLKGIGESKLKQLIAAGCHTVRQLIELQPRDFAVTNSHTKLSRWKRIAESDLLKRRKEKDWLQEKLDNKILELVVADAEADEDPLGDETPASDEPTEGSETENINTLPSLLSKMNDVSGYNARVISKYRIDNIVISEFQLRKEVMESKMMSLSAEMLKLDFNYKIASKIRVWKGQGDSFSPFKCIATVQNEDALTVFWKGIKHSESITEMIPDLTRLRDRLDRNCSRVILPGDGAVRVVHVDNCCHVCLKIRSVFGSFVWVKLDPFHWLQRWNEALLEPTSVQGGIARQMFSRAIFNIDSTEMDNARQRLEERKVKDITNRKVLKEANAVIPCPAILRSNIEAVIQYLFNEDAKTQSAHATRSADDNAPLPQTYWKKNSSLVQDVIRRQMKHVDDGCLSDPPDVSLFKMNPRTGMIFTARGTNTNERDNLDLATKILTATVIGLHRAERLIYTYFEGSNHRKRIRRCGDEDDGTHHTEKLALINTFAKSLGYNNIPYPNLALPSIENTFREHIGFSYRTTGEDVSNPTTNQHARYNGVDPDDAINDDDLASLLMDIDFGLEVEEDVEVSVEEDLEPLEVEPDTLRQLNFAEVADKTWASDLTHGELINQTVSRLLPPTAGRETTLESFKRLTLESPWIPFRTINSTKPKTRLDEEEEDLFANFLATGKCSAHVSPGAAKGFNHLEKDWNLEAARRFRDWTTGEDVKLINRKSTQQLLDYYKKKLEWERLLPLVDHDNPNRTRLGSVLRSNRRMLPAPPPTAMFTPLVYHNQRGRPAFGAPMPLNTTILAGAFDTATGALRRPQNVPVNRRVFRSRMFCTTCGAEKKEHAPVERNMKPWVCFRGCCHCCGRLQQCHDRGMMGPKCRNAEHPIKWCNK